jgi:hypothetical protein
MVEGRGDTQLDMTMHMHIEVWETRAPILESYSAVNGIRCTVHHASVPYQMMRLR